MHELLNTTAYFVRWKTMDLKRVGVLNKKEYAHLNTKDREREKKGWGTAERGKDKLETSCNL